MRDAREDRAGHEVGREDRAVPARAPAPSRSPTTRRCAPRTPAASRARRRTGRRRRSASTGSWRRSSRTRAACRQLHDRVLGAVAQRRDVGDQADQEEDARDREVGGDREHVPLERRAEVGPQLALVRVREQPVVEPRRARVWMSGNSAGGQHAEHGHRLGDAVDGAPEVRAEQEQDRRHQRAAVRDADPEHEVRDVARPTSPGACSRRRRSRARSGCAPRAAPTARTSRSSRNTAHQIWPGSRSAQDVVVERLLRDRIVGTSLVRAVASSLVGVVLTRSLARAIAARRPSSGRSRRAWC